MQIYANFYLIMLIYANFFLIMLIYANFMQILMKFLDKAKKPWLMSNKLLDRNVKQKSSSLSVYTKIWNFWSLAESMKY